MKQKYKKVKHKLNIHKEAPSKLMKS